MRPLMTPEARDRAAADITPQDTFFLARTLAKDWVFRLNGLTWFFAHGNDQRREVEDVIRANGGRVVMG